MRFVGCSGGYALVWIYEDCKCSFFKKFIGVVNVLDCCPPGKVALVTHYILFLNLSFSLNFSIRIYFHGILCP